MKKGILFTSLALLSSITLAGCSCSKEGTYAFSHIEYGENGQHKQSNCANPSSTQEINYCEIVTSLALNTYSFSLEDGKLSYFVAGSTEEPKSVYYKIQKGEFLFSDKEDGEFKQYTGEHAFQIVYADNNFEIRNDYYSIVYKK